MFGVSKVPKHWGGGDLFVLYWGVEIELYYTERVEIDPCYIERVEIEHDISRDKAKGIRPLYEAGDVETAS